MGTTATTNPSPSTAHPGSTLPGGIVTITGGPNATANVLGPHNDPADFYGIILSLAAILVAVALTRLIFRTRRDSGPRSTRPTEPPPPGQAPEEPGRN